MIKWLAVCSVLIGCFITPVQAQVVVLDGGTLIDGTGRNPITNAVVVIEGNRIKAAVKDPSRVQAVPINGGTGAWIASKAATDAIFQWLQQTF